jgi:outer membrane murein-binding lipoprotein Lpp
MESKKEKLSERVEEMENKIDELKEKVDEEMGEEEMVKKMDD